MSVGGLVGSNYGIIADCDSTSTVSGYNTVGGLVGSSPHLIANCYSTGIVSGSHTVGGLVGINGTVFHTGSESWCEVPGSIYGSYSTAGVFATGSRSGGLVGLNYPGEINNCYATGSVEGKSNVGGLVGQNSSGLCVGSSICKCFSTGRVSGAEYAGGLVGYSQGNITNCYSTGVLIGKRGIGGLVGRNWWGTLIRSHCSGAVNGKSSVGGLVGENNDAHVSCCYNTGVVAGDDDVGGLVGTNWFGSVLNCYSMGPVGGDRYVGGLVGSNRRGHVTQCYSTGTVDGSHSVAGLVGSNSDGHVSQCYSIGAVTGDSSVGGLVGWNSWDATVTHCYSSGSVLGTADVGGLIGEDGGKVWAVWASFWDIETSGQTTSADGTGKTTVQMQTRSTFTDAGWDFVGESVNGTDDIWWILEGRSYPRLWWQYGWAFSAHPPDGAIDVTQPLILSWIAGGSNLHHDVYFGDDEQAVANATTETAGIYRGRQAADVTTYDPGILELDKTYYWRIDGVDEADANSPWKGNVWSFTTANFIVVDDFEEYNDYSPYRIFQTWIDGWGYTEPAPGHPGNGTGSCVDCLGFVERWVVHSGQQSMPFDYDNTGTAGRFFYSETERTWDTSQDWTREGVKALTLWFYGDPCNAAEPLYVAVEDSMGKIKVINHDDANAVQLRGWQEWNIDLKQFTGTGLNLEAVKKMYIGVGDRDAPQRGGTGQLYFDDIRLYRPRCIASIFKPEADLSGNCVVDLADIAILASQWLQSGAGLAADLDADGDVDFGDFAQIADAWLEQLLWPQP